MPTGKVKSTCCVDELTSVSKRLTSPGSSNEIVFVRVPVVDDVLSVTVPSFTISKLNDASSIFFWLIPSRISKLKR